MDTHAHILIADDDATIRDALRTKLESEGFRVTEAANGAEAVAQSTADRPDLIIMDVRMPDTSGTEAVVRIKSDPALRDIRIVFLSSLGEEEAGNVWMDQKYAREMGAVDFLKKDDDLNQIVEKIRAILNA